MYSRLERPIDFKTGPFPNLENLLLCFPFYQNLGKRLVKSPKIYFSDTALAPYLMGLYEREALLNGPGFEALFRTIVVMDVWKRRRSSPGPSGGFR